MSEDLASAMIGAASAIAAAGIAACVAMRTLGSELRKNREARQHERQRDRDARLHELRRATYGGLVDNTIRQGVSQLVLHLNVPVESRALFVDEVVRFLRPLMEAHLVASTDTILQLMAAGRATLQHTPLVAYSRPMLAAMWRFAQWAEHQIPLLLEVRCDLGFDRSEIPALKEAWAEHLRWQLDWMRQVDAELAARALAPVVGDDRPPEAREP